MNELGEICRYAREQRELGEPLYIAQVVRVSGSAYRRPGARLLFTTGRALSGSISAGCLEADVLRTGPWLCSRGPKLRRYETSADDERPSGSGCEGASEVLIEQDLGPCPGDPLAFIESCLAEERRGVLATIFRSALASAAVGSRICWQLGQPTVSTVKNPAVASVLARAAEERLLGAGTHGRVVSVGESVDALIEVVEPPPHLFVFGTGVDALPVIELASLLGWNVTVCAREGRPVVSDRFARIARLMVDEPARCVEAIDGCLHPLALVMSHDFQGDTAALGALLRSRCEYIGVLGPSSRLERMLDELPPLPAFARTSVVHGPAGLDLGAETPTEIAFSILAEAQAALRRSSATSLRELPGPIHEPSDPASGVRLREPSSADPGARSGA